MIIPLLVLALASAAPSPVRAEAPAVTSARLDKIETLSEDWLKYKTKSHRALETLAALRDGKPEAAEWRRAYASIWEIAVRVESQQEVLLNETLKFAKSKGKTPAELARIEDVLHLRRQVRLLRVYGDMLPRALDESFLDENSKPAGRRVAGKDWEQALTDKEGIAAGMRIDLRIGLPAAEFSALEARVLAEFDAKHPPKNP